MYKSKEYYKKNRKRILDYQKKLNYFKFITQYRIKGRYIEEDKALTESDINYLKKLGLKDKNYTNNSIIEE